MGHDVILADLYTEQYGSSNITEQAIRLQLAEAIVLVFPTW